ncbi:Hypothetical predicted protein [Mytilus galloprovincialis]|uniref:CUB domain-containing protein n=1 Tax=Mytilus galloprovincialis TaxID=29158 RepID=A0A8B6DBU3_MYTGA|nr:Hypothetical predicted protein [Mytilus galloprovincialis]
MSLGRFSTFVIVLTAFFGSSFCLNIIPDYFMNSGGLGNCGETINNKEDVYIRSHTGAYQLGSIINYGANENCELTFNAGTGKKVLIKFIEFELENAAGNECLDGLEIFDHQNTTTSTNSYNMTVSYNCTINNNATIDNCTAANNCSLDNCTVANNCSIENTTLTNLCTMENSSSLTNEITADLTVCGSAGPSPFVSDSSEVRFKFYTNSLNHFSGFQLLVTSFREADNCSSNEFQCDTNRCIPTNLKCDTVQHCVDGTDENDDIAGCTIFDKLLGYVFGLGQLTVITIAILGGVIIFSIITFIIVYHVCKKKHNRVNDIQEAGPATSRNTHNRDSRKGQKGKRTVTVVAPAPHTSEASKSTRKQTSGKKSKKRSDEEDDPFW